MGTVKAIKAVLNTTHGRRGFLTPDCMYFAVAADEEEDLWVQIDVKVCFKPELFTWCTFEYNYASNSKIVGSMVKPLGLTLDPQGLHIRLEEMEDRNFPGSMIWTSKDPKDVLRIVGLDRRLLDAGFNTKNEIYESFTASWLFNPAHFVARLADEKYANRLEDRAPHWMHFLKDWLPENYPDHRDSARPQEDLEQWYKCTRAAVRDKVFTMFPNVAAQYYVKRAVHMKDCEEFRLRNMITAAIPIGSNGWKDDLPQPLILLKRQEQTIIGELTPPLTPTTSIEDPPNGAKRQLTLGNDLTPPPSPSISCQIVSPVEVPLYLDHLDRTPPFICTPHPPPINMSPEAKLLCLARWTHFDPETGTPYLLTFPHPKGFDMHWADAAHVGATDGVLVEWAKTKWWPIWIRQSHANFVGMWKKRFEQEEMKAEKVRLDAEVKKKEERVVEAARAKIRERLRRLKMNLLVGNGCNLAI